MLVNLFSGGCQVAGFEWLQITEHMHVLQQHTHQRCCRKIGHESANKVLCVDSIIIVVVIVITPSLP